MSLSLTASRNNPKQAAHRFFRDALALLELQLQGRGHSSMDKYVRITGKRQVTIPKEFFEQLDMGTVLHAFVEGGRLVLEPVRSKDLMDFSHDEGTGRRGSNGGTGQFRVGWRPFHERVDEFQRVITRIGCRRERSKFSKSLKTSHYFANI